MLIRIYHYSKSTPIHANPCASTASRKEDFEFPFEDWSENGWKSEARPRVLMCLEDYLRPSVCPLAALNHYHVPTSHQHSAAAYHEIRGRPLYPVSSIPNQLYPIPHQSHFHSPHQPVPGPTTDTSAALATLQLRNASPAAKEAASRMLSARLLVTALNDERNACVLAHRLQTTMVSDFPQHIYLPYAHYIWSVRLF
jgi:hypothetical protein